MSVIVPGSYDPVTLGHIDIIRRSAEKYGEVYAVIFVNPDKKYTFSLEDRLKMLMLATDKFENVLVSYSSGLVIDYMREHGIEKIVKGYRNERDLEYEKKQAEWNFLHGGYETELLECHEEFHGISSTEVRRILKEGGTPFGLVPDEIIGFLKKD